MVKTFKISSDKIQANLSKFSNSIHNKLDEKGKCKLSVNCISSQAEDSYPTADFYKPAADSYKSEPDYDYEDPSAGFCDPATDCIAPTSHEIGHNIATPGDTDLTGMTEMRPGLSQTMRGKLHTANKKLSMIRSRS